MRLIVPLTARALHNLTILRNTRMAKLDAPDGPYAALVLAKAGMVRVGMGARITSDVPPPTLFYAVSQGALGIEIRSDDPQRRRRGARPV